MKFKSICTALLLSLPLSAQANSISTFSQAQIESKELLVSFEAGLTKVEKEEIIARQGGVILKHFKTNNSALVKMPEVSGLLPAANALSITNKVTHVGPNRTFTLFETTTNDPGINQQYHHKNIKSGEAWDISTGSQETLVAVVDTGIYLEHEDLVDNLWKNPGETGLDENGNDKATNGIDDDNNGYVDDFQGWDFIDGDNIPNDDHGHGTHCAGLVGAVGDNGTGVTGVNWDVSIVGLKIFNGRGSTTEAAIVEAIEYSTMMGIKISNHSWGGPDSRGDKSTDLVYQALKAGQEEGQLFVFAAGNSSSNSDVRPMVPGAYDLDAILNVASTTQSDSMSGFSNYGATTVDIGAPGSAIYSTLKKRFLRKPYGNMSGTSMASPIVAGAAALVNSVYPDMTAAEIKAKLMDTSDKVQSLEGKTVTGGRLNVLRAITE